MNSLKEICVKYIIKNNIKYSLPQENEPISSDTINKECFDLLQLEKRPKVVIYSRSWNIYNIPFQD